ncbi:MAG: hypothetical protein WCF84_27370 [Anaerolineae bacterium]
MTIRDFDSFDEREQPPMSAEMFATVVMARLRPVADIVVESHRGLEFQLRIRGESRLAHLDGYYRRYRSAPQKLTSLVQELIVSFQRGAAPADRGQMFDDAAPHLLPLLMTSAEWNARRASGLRLVIRPLVDDLGIALVVDEPNAVTYVQLAAFPQWGVDMVTAYDTAMNNLSRLADAHSVSQVGEGEEMLLIDRSPDGYAATRAILPSRLEEWSRRVPGELVLGLPTRNFLIGFSGEHPNRAALAAQVEADAHASEPGLMSKLLVYRNGALQLFG